MIWNATKRGRWIAARYFNEEELTMRIISIVSQKGGAGKTTLAVNLAVAAEEAGARARIYDIDPQGSALAWSDQRDASAPAVRMALPHRLPLELEEAEADGCEIVIVDSAPHAESASLTAARVADLVVIPCRPSMFDLHAIEASLEITQLAGTPAVVALNAVPARGPLAGEATAALSRRGVTVLSHAVGQRQAFVHALNHGLGAVEFEPRGKAAAEIRSLWAALVRRERPDLRLVG